jgi:hypothetical protein
MTIDKALERLNNKLSFLAAAGGIAAAVAPDKVLPFIYSHWVWACIYLLVGVAPIQELFHPLRTWQKLRTEKLGIVWALKFAALWVLVLFSMLLLIRQVKSPPPSPSKVTNSTEKPAPTNPPTRIAVEPVDMRKDKWDIAYILATLGIAVTTLIVAGISVFQATLAKAALVATQRPKLVVKRVSLIPARSRMLMELQL